MRKIFWSSSKSLGLGCDNMIPHPTPAPGGGGGLAMSRHLIIQSGVVN